MDCAVCVSFAEGSFSGMIDELSAAVLEKVVQCLGKKSHSFATGGINRMTQELELHSVLRELSFLWPHRLVLLIRSREILAVLNN